MSYLKDPSALLDFGWDWTPWLADGETISSHTITASDGITVDSHSETDGVVTVWLAGGTAGDNYEITCRVNTSAGRTDDRTFTVRVRER